MIPFGKALGLSLVASLVLGVIACGGTKDVIPETHDERVAANVEADSGAESYTYIARRPLGVVGLAEARGLPNDVARRAIDHLADALDTCATDLGRQGRLVDGAARVVAMIGGDGAVVGLNVKVSPGASVAANALLCVITPLKLTSFPPADADAGSRGIAIETAWGPQTVGALRDGG